MLPADCIRCNQLKGIARWKTGLLLSIILPICLFVSLRMSGTLRGPATMAGKTIAGSTSWSMVRPILNLNLYSNVENTYSSPAISANFCIHTWTYLEEASLYPARGNDYLKFSATGAANVSSGLICSVAIRFSRTDSKGLLTIYEASETRQFENLKYTTSNVHGNSGFGAFLEAVAPNTAKRCLLSVTVAWIFTDLLHAYDHQITATLEITYYDGNNYRMLDVPIQLTVLRK